MPFPGQQRTAAPEKFKTVSPSASTRRRSGAGSAKFHSTTRPSTRASTRIGDVPSHVVALLQGKGKTLWIHFIHFVSLSQTVQVVESKLV